MKDWRLINFIALVILAILMLTPNEATARSLLERLLVSISVDHAQANWNMKANIAENYAGIATAARVLTPGDKVVIGYDAGGTPVEAISGVNGISVTPLQANALQSGLAAGLYPAGSRLYALPPGAQLSLYEAAEDGRALAAAQELFASLIDGRITMLMYSTLPVELAEIAVISEGLNFGDFGAIASTALGAVNTGEIVTGVRIEPIAGPIGFQVDLLKAQIAHGPNATIDAAVTDSLHAVSSRVLELGGSPNSAVLALNYAGNTMTVTTAILNQVSGVSLKINSLVSTAIGAVNGGIVGR